VISVKEELAGSVGEKNDAVAGQISQLETELASIRVQLAGLQPAHLASTGGDTGVFIMPVVENDRPPPPSTIRNIYLSGTLLPFFSLFWGGGHFTIYRTHLTPPGTRRGSVGCKITLSSYILCYPRSVNSKE
jgi:hypothetical protein